MRKTKILVTLGPSIEDKLDEVLPLVDGVRFNMSHTTPENCSKFLNILDKYNVAKLMDLKGIKIRIIYTKFDYLKEGQIIEIGKDLKFNYEIKNLKKGDSVVIDDGKILLEMIDYKKAKVIHGGEIKLRKGVNFPETHIDYPIIDDFDIECIKFACENNFEYIALSFVRDKKDIDLLKKYIEEFGGNCKIISKIETKESLKNLDEIIKNSYGVMVARGDLGVEVPIYEIPIHQKKIISLANKYGKMSIVATQMLNTMVENPYPTRAEITDIANAIYDGADCLMLSNETAVGKYPIKAIEVLHSVIRMADKTYKEFGKVVELEKSEILHSLSASIKNICEELNIKLIITPTYSGRTPQIVSKAKPDAEIVALTPNPFVYRVLRLIRGVEPILTEEFKDIEEGIRYCKKIAKEKINKGRYLITLGHPVNQRKTNVIKIDEV